jgi:ubiquitin C-terminal hydrolase
MGSSHSIPPSHGSFEFSLGPDYTPDIGFSSQRFTLLRTEFVACYLPAREELVIYLASATSIPERETKRYAIEIQCGEDTFPSTFQFSRTQHFCSFSAIAVPCTITVTSLSESLVSEEVHYAGITNMGLTCYAASSLQFLLTSVPFLNLLFEHKANAKSVGAELQSLFACLLDGQSHAHVKELLKSFGFAAHDFATSEQDSHEFLLTSFDKIDKEFGRDFEKARNEIFGVIGVRSINCQVANLNQSTEELSNEIQLPLDDFSSVHESLQHITASEELTGSNQWDTGTDQGKQDAVRGFRYNKLPPFLILNLGRYRFSPKSGRCEEVRSFFDCPEDLDLSEFCTDDFHDSAQYRMVALVAHRGNPQSGHYIACTQPKLDGRWFQFDDRVVSPATFTQIRDTFGGKSNIVSHVLSYFARGSFVAYLVGYIRVDCIEEFRK